MPKQFPTFFFVCDKVHDHERWWRLSNKENWGKERLWWCLPHHKWTKYIASCYSSILLVRGSHSSMCFGVAHTEHCRSYHKPARNWWENFPLMSRAFEDVVAGKWGVLSYYTCSSHLFYQGGQECIGEWSSSLTDSINTAAMFILLWQYKSYCSI